MPKNSKKPPRIKEVVKVKIVGLDNIDIQDTKDVLTELDIMYTISKLKGVNKKVFQLLYEGLTYREIAKDLKISNHTIKKIIEQHKHLFTV